MKTARQGSLELRTLPEPERAVNFLSFECVCIGVSWASCAYEGALPTLLFQTESLTEPDWLPSLYTAQRGLHTTECLAGHALSGDHREGSVPGIFLVITEPEFVSLLVGLCSNVRPFLLKATLHTGFGTCPDAKGHSLYC